MERTVAELQGISCIDLEAAAPPEKSIVSSKSFGTMVPTLEELSQVLSRYVTHAAEKLRAQHSVAGAIHVFLQTNVFRQGDPQYCNGMAIPLPNPSADTMVLTGTALAGLKAIYREGYAYKKVGCILLDISPAVVVQGWTADSATTASKR